MFAVAACPLCENCPLGDTFNYKTPHFPFRWKEEDEGDWQRGEPCLEWGSLILSQLVRRMFNRADFSLIAERLCSDDIGPLWTTLISVAASCLRCWSSTWREHRWTLPPALMWLWKTTRLSAKISKCGSWVWVCATCGWVMKEKMFAFPHSSQPRSVAGWIKSVLLLWVSLFPSHNEVEAQSEDRYLQNNP